MTRLALLCLSVSLGLFGSESVRAGHRSKTIRYPRVYGPAGRPYGPTQAHYQYQKRYGRPWHGYGGLTAHFGRQAITALAQLDYGFLELLPG